MKKVCVVTGSRAEYGLFKPVLHRIERTSGLTLQLVATTMHLSPEFGNTYREIEADGFVIDETIDNLVASETCGAMARSSGLATMLLSDAFARLDPDVVLLLGDRFETHAAATAAVLMNIPIAHIHGGEVTEGALDEKLRHAITKMASLHFTATEAYRRRVMQMGEAPETVFCTGAPGIDNILELPLLERQALEEELEWEMGDTCILFTYHSETASDRDTIEDIRSILEILEGTDANVLLTYANADIGGREINREIERFAAGNPKKYKAVASLGQKRYLSAMREADCLVGNTSSGIIEAASFGTPVVNIGDRQKGRIRGANVIDSTIGELRGALKQAFSEDFRRDCGNVENPYGDGRASERIVSLLENVTITQRKPFIDLEFGENL